MNNNLTTNQITLIKERISYQFIVDHHTFTKSNLKMETYIHHSMEGTVFNMTQYFLTRKLTEDYTYRHPKNLFHLLLFFCFGWWTWFRYNVVKWTEHKITVQEAYGNISIPEQNPVIYVRQIENNVDVPIGNKFGCR